MINVRKSDSPSCTGDITIRVSCKLLNFGTIDELMTGRMLHLSMEVKHDGDERNKAQNRCAILTSKGRVSEQYVQVYSVHHVRNSS